MLRCYERRIWPAYRKPHTCRQRRAALTRGMTCSEPARTTTPRIPGLLVAALLVVIAAIAAVGHQLLASSSSTASSLPPSESPIAVLRSEHRGPLGEADGAVPDHTTVFDSDVPGVAKLDPALRGALRRA